MYTDYIEYVPRNELGFVIGGFFRSVADRYTRMLKCKRCKHILCLFFVLTRVHERSICLKFEKHCKNQ